MRLGSLKWASRKRRSVSTVALYVSANRGKRCLIHSRYCRMNGGMAGGGTEMAGKAAVVGACIRAFGLLISLCPPALSHSGRMRWRCYCRGKCLRLEGRCGIGDPSMWDVEENV